MDLRDKDDMNEYLLYTSYLHRWVQRALDACWLHIERDWNLTIMVCVIKPQVSLELEADWIRIKTKITETDAGQTEVKMQPMQHKIKNFNYQAASYRSRACQWTVKLFPSIHSVLVLNMFAWSSWRCMQCSTSCVSRENVRSLVKLFPL